MKSATKVIIVPNKQYLWHLLTNPLPLKIDPFKAANVKKRREMLRLVRGGK